MECYQPYDYNWNAQNKLYDNWINGSTNVFQNTKCFAICGSLIKPSRKAFF